MSVKKIRTVMFRILAGITVGLTLSIVAYCLHFNLSSATSIHLFLVVLIALRWGFLEASLVSIFSVACLDFFFTAPVFAFYMSDSQDWVSLLTFEAAVLLVSQLSNQIMRHAKDAETHQGHLQKLYELSQHILLLDQTKTVEDQIAGGIRINLQVHGVALWNAQDQRLGKSGVCGLTDEEIQLAYRTERDSEDLRSGLSLRVLRSGTRQIGMLVLCGHSLDTGSVNATASLTSIAMDRARSFSAEASAEASRQSEQLRSAILDGLAHAFKSPLTTIQVSSSGLLAMKTLSGGEEKLVALIDRQAARLSDLANHLLLTAKLDRDDLKLQLKDVDAVQLLENCVESCSKDATGHAMRTQTRVKRSLIKADAKLLRMAVILLLDNAVKYSKPGSSIMVGLWEDGTETVITISNEGSFIPPQEREKIFRRFYRCTGSNGKVSGTGIGLSVVMRVVEAHYGSVSVDSDLVSGTTFTIVLPKANLKELV